MRLSRFIGALLVATLCGCSCNMKSFYKPVNLEVSYDDIGVIEVEKNIDLIISYAPVSRLGQNDEIAMQIYAMLEVGPESKVQFVSDEISIQTPGSIEKRTVQIESIEYTISCPAGKKDWAACYSSNKSPVDCSLKEVPSNYPVFHRYSFSPDCEFSGAIDSEPEGVRYRLFSRDFRRYVLITKSFKMQNPEQVVIQLPSVMLNGQLHHIKPVILKPVREEVCRPIPVQ